MSFSLVLVPCIQYSHCTITISSFLIGLVLAVGLGLGIGWIVSQTDIQNVISDALQEYFNLMSYSSISDWLGPDWQSNISTFEKYLKIPFGQWVLIKQFWNWYRSSRNLSSGTVTAPSNSLVSGGTSLATNIGSFQVSSNVFNSQYGYTRFANFDIYGLSFVPSSMVAFYLSDINNVFPFSFSVNGTSHSISVIYLTSPYPCYDFALDNVPFSRVFVSRTDDTWLNIKQSSPLYLCLVDRGQNQCLPFVYYTSFQYDSLLTAWKSGSSPLPFTSAPYSVLASDYGEFGYTFNSSDPIYLDLQLGNLSSSISALSDLISALNQNLVSYTIALQEASSSDLPIDTTPFIQLVQSYENLTNDCINGNITVTSALSSMYTLLSQSIGRISNPSLENACLSAYNAFLNKLSLFQSVGGSATNFTFTTVQTLQSTLDTYYQSFSGGSITYDQMLSTAAGALSTSVSSATSTQEIISLNNVYRSFLSRVGADLDSSTYSKDVIDGFHETLDDYEDGTISRSQALSSLKSDYRSGISGTVSAVDVAAITAAYQASVDQIAVSEFDISSELGQVSADSIALEDDLLEQLDFNSLQAEFAMQSWQFMPDREANLYREYFEQFLDEDSPFWTFLYYPLVLSLMGIVLGTAISFGVKATHKKSGGGRPRQ